MATKKDKQIIERMFMTEYARKRPGLWGQTEVTINRKTYHVFNNGHYAFACPDDFGYKKLEMTDFRPAENYFIDFRNGVKNADYVQVNIPTGATKDYIAQNKERRTDYSFLFYVHETPVAVNPVYLRDMVDFIKPKSIWMSRRSMRRYVCYSKPIFFWNPDSYKIGLLLPRNVGVQVNQVTYNRIYEYLDDKAHVIENMYAEKLTTYYMGLEKAEKYIKSEIDKYIATHEGNPEGAYSLLVCIRYRMEQVQKYMIKKIGVMS